MDKDTRISQLEDEVCKLRAELEKAQSGVSSERWGRAFDTLPDGAVFHSERDMQTGKLVFKHVSSAWEEILGVSVEDTLTNSENVMSRVHPDDLQELFQAMNQAATDAKKLEVEFRYLHPGKEGEEYWLELTSYPVLESNKVVADGFLFNVTERKRTVVEILRNKEKAEENNIRLSLLMDAAVSGLWNLTIDYEGSKKPVYNYVWSDEMRKLLGFSGEEDFPNIERSWGDRLHPDDKDGVYDKFNQYLLDKNETGHFEAEYRMVHKNGEYLYLHDVCTMTRDQDGRPLHLIGAIRDVTELKHAEQKLFAEKIRLEKMSNNIPDSVLYRIVSDTETGKAYMEYAGKNWDDVVGTPVSVFEKDLDLFHEMVLPDDRERVRAANAYSIRTLKDFNVEFRFPVKGEIRWLYLSSKLYRKGTQVFADGICVNITARKEAEIELEIEKERLQNLGDNIPYGTIYRYVYDTETCKHSIEYVSAGWEKTMGYSAELALNDLDKAFSHVHPDDLSRLHQSVEESIKTMNTFDVEYRLIIDGATRWVRKSAHPRRDGKLIIWDGLGINITERKEAQAKLSFEKERLQMLGDNIPNGALFQFTLDAETGLYSFEYLSARWEEVMGFSSENALKDKQNSFAHIHPDDLPMVKKVLEESAKTLQPFETEHRNVVDGRVHWVHMSSHARRENGHIIWDGIAVNITARKETEMKLKLEKERLTTLGDNIPNGVLFQYSFNKNTGIFSFDYVSAQWEEVMGFSADFALNDKKNTYSTVHPDDLPLLQQKLKHTIETLEPFNFEHRNIGDDGKIRWIDMSCHARRENDIVILDGIAINTTKRKEAEMFLEQEKERIETLGNNIPNGALYQFILDKKTGKFSYTYVNTKWLDVVGCSSDDFLNYLDNDIPRDHPILEAVTVSAENLSVFDFQLYFEYRENAPRWLHFTSQPQTKGDIIVWDGIAIDVSARKEADRKLEEERKRLEALGSNLPDVALYQFVKNTVTGKMFYSYVSGTWEKITGVPVHVAMNDAQAVIDSIHPDDKEHWKQTFEHAMSTLNDFYVEVRTIVDGRVRWRQMSSRLRREGDLVIADGTMLDITLRKEAEIKLELENKRLHTLGDNIPSGALYRCVLDTITNKINIDYVSAQWENVMGYSSELTLRDTEKTFEYIHPEDLAYVQGAIEHSARTLTVFNVEYRLIIDGRIRWIQVASQPRLNNGMIIWDGIALNITVRKEAEHKLKLEHDRIEALGNNLPGVILYQFVCDKKTNKWDMTYISQAWSIKVGITTDDAIKDFNKLLSFVHPEDLPQLIIAINNSVETLENFYYEARFVVNGETRWIQLSSRLHLEGDLVVADGIMMDITVRKEAVLKLEQEHNRLESLGANLPDVALYQFISDTQTGQWHFSYVSGSWETVTGIPGEVVTRDINTVFAIVHPDDLDTLMKAIKEAHDNMTNFSHEMRLIVHGKTRWVHLSSRHRREGIFVIADGILMDITTRKKAEHELEYERNRLQTLGDNLPGGCLFQFVRDSRTGQMRFSYVSATWEAVTGVPAEQAMSNVSQLFSSMRTEELPAFLRTIDESARTMTDFNIVFRTKERWLHIVSRPRTEENMVAWDGIVMDITAEKTAELALAAEKERLETLGDNFPNGVLQRFVFDNDTQKYYMEYVSSRWEEISGLTHASIVDDISPLFDALHPDDLPHVLEATDTSRKNMTDFDIETRIINKGETRWLRIVTHPYALDNKVVWDGVTTDITTRKLTEMALEDSERKHRFIFENTKEMFWVADAKTFDITFVGGAAMEMYGLTNEEIAQKNMFDFFETQSGKNLAAIIKEAIEIYNAEGVLQNIMYVEQQFRKDGSPVWIETSAQLVADENGHITQLVGIDRNIDERVKIEKELAQYREHLELMVQERTQELQKAVNELAAISEELFAANEELSASNEELNTTNDQLETTMSDLRASNEELQSTSEELVSTNEELQQKNEQLAAVTAEHERMKKELEGRK